MRLTAIISHTTTLAIAVTLLLGAALAQEEPAGPPPLILQPGTILTARTDQALSSEHNQAGDLFSGSLTQPVVAQVRTVTLPSSVQASTALSSTLISIR